VAGQRAFDTTASGISHGFPGFEYQPEGAAELTSGRLNPRRTPPGSQISRPAPRNRDDPPSTAASRGAQKAVGGTDIDAEDTRRLAADLERRAEIRLERTL
jgi:hypothetical protein